MKSMMKFLLSTILFMFIFSVSSYAAEEDNSNEALETYVEDFVLSENQLSFVEPEPFVVDSEDSLLMAEEDFQEPDYLTFGEFKFSKGFSQLISSTFSCEKSLIGQGLENTEIGILIYQENIFGDKDILFQSYKVLGASGLYSNVIKFKPDSVQYVVIAVRSNDTTIHRVFEVTTKTLETKLLLETIEINFTVNNESPANTDSNSLYELLNVPSIDF